MVELSHRLESAFAALGGDGSPWSAGTADLIVEVTDGLRGYLDQLAIDEREAAPMADRLREQILHIAAVHTRDSAPELRGRDSVTVLDARDSSNDLAGESLSMPTVTDLGAPDAMPESVSGSPTCLPL